jgi:hypothetical protein
MPRKTRKYYQPHTDAAKAKISEGLRRYHERVRMALTRLDQHSGGGDGSHQ